MTRPALLDVLVCPQCAGRFVVQDDAALSCTGCGYCVRIQNGVPRFVEVPDDAIARRTQASFGYEWTHFSNWSDSGATNFAQYFEGVDFDALRGARVLDAGCGMGRHARMVAGRVAHVIAVDFSSAIDQAARNTRDLANVDCVQADICALPLADGAFDFVYSMGVLHHLRDTADALTRLVRKARTGGRVRIYLYWKHRGLKGLMLKCVDVARIVTTRLPHRILRMLCWVVSGALMVGLILPYRILTRLGLHWHERLPLFLYARYPFTILYNDQFDRFSAPLEQRFDKDEVRSLLEHAGLRDVTVRASFGWIGEGVR